MDEETLLESLNRVSYENAVLTTENVAYRAEIVKLCAENAALRTRLDACCAELLADAEGR